MNLHQVNNNLEAVTTPHNNYSMEGYFTTSL